MLDTLTVLTNSVWFINQCTKNC